MKAVMTKGWGLSPQLTVAERSEPGRLGAEDVLVQVHAASVNPKDWKLNYNAARLAGPLLIKTLPPLFGDDLAGTVLAVGSRVRDFAVGDAVYGMDMRPRTASLAEKPGSISSASPTNPPRCRLPRRRPCLWRRRPPCRGCARVRQSQAARY